MQKKPRVELQKDKLILLTSHVEVKFEKEGSYEDALEKEVEIQKENEESKIKVFSLKWGTQIRNNKNYKAWGCFETTMKRSWDSKFEGVYKKEVHLRALK